MAARKRDASRHQTVRCGSAEHFCNRDSDDILIREEKAANAAGARALGFEDAADLVAAIRAGEISGVVMLGHDLLDERYLEGTAELAGLEALIVLDLQQSDVYRVAHVVRVDGAPLVWIYQRLVD